MSKTTNAAPGVASVFAGQVFIASLLLGAGVVASCELRATKAGECITSYGAAAITVITGAGLQATYLVGLNTINPALDPIRKAQLLAESGAVAGAAPPDPEPPEWALDPRLVLNDHEADA